MNSIQPVILSGGSGTRLWPLSREAYPKQFLPLASELTMLQATWKRVEAIAARGPLVIANEEHRFVDFTPDFATWVIFYGAVKKKPG